MIIIFIAKSRKIEVSAITNSISVKKRQLIAVMITFALLPGSIIVTSYLIYYSIFIDKTYFLLTLLIIYFIYISSDKCYENGSRPLASFKKLNFWLFLSNYFPILLDN